MGDYTIRLHPAEEGGYTIRLHPTEEDDEWSDVNIAKWEERDKLDPEVKAWLDRQRRPLKENEGGAA